MKSYLDYILSSFTLQLTFCHPGKCFAKNKKRMTRKRRGRKNVKLLRNIFRFYYRCVVLLGLKRTRKIMLCVVSCLSFHSHAIYICDNVTFCFLLPHINGNLEKRSAKQYRGGMRKFCFMFLSIRFKFVLFFFGKQLRHDRNPFLMSRFKVENLQVSKKALFWN
jgi:hypothetical protein